MNKNQFIISKDKTSPLSFIEVTPNEYRFVFDDYDKHMKLNNSMKNLLFVINEESKKNKRISIQNLTWCGGGITIVYDYQNKPIKPTIDNGLKITADISSIILKPS